MFKIIFLSIFCVQYSFASPDYSLYQYVDSFGAGKSVKLLKLEKSPELASFYKDDLPLAVLIQMYEVNPKSLNYIKNNKHLNDEFVKRVLSAYKFNDLPLPPFILNYKNFKKIEESAGKQLASKETKKYYTLLIEGLVGDDSKELMKILNALGTSLNNLEIIKSIFSNKKYLQSLNWSLLNTKIIFSDEVLKFMATKKYSKKEQVFPVLIKDKVLLSLLLKNNSISVIGDNALNNLSTEEKMRIYKKEKLTDYDIRQWKVCDKKLLHETYKDNGPLLDAYSRCSLKLAESDFLLLKKRGFKSLHNIPEETTKETWFIDFVTEGGGYGECYESRYFKGVKKGVISKKKSFFFGTLKECKEKIEHVKVPKTYIEKCNTDYGTELGYRYPYMFQIKFQELSGKNDNVLGNTVIYQADCNKSLTNRFEKKRMEIINNAKKSNKGICKIAISFKDREMAIKELPTYKSKKDCNTELINAKIWAHNTCASNTVYPMSNGQRFTPKEIINKFILKTFWNESLNAVEEIICKKIL